MWGFGVSQWPWRKCCTVKHISVSLFINAKLFLTSRRQMKTIRETIIQITAPCAIVSAKCLIFTCQCWDVFELCIVSILFLWVSWKMWIYPVPLQTCSHCYETESLCSKWHTLILFTAYCIMFSGFCSIVVHHITTKRFPGCPDDFLSVRESVDALNFGKIYFTRMCTPLVCIVHFFKMYYDGCFSTPCYTAEAWQQA